MDQHDWWHLVVLGTTLFGAAALGILVLSKLIFDEAPPGLSRWAAVVWWVVGMAAILLIVEWLGIH